jgi:hypothetical protein
MAYLFLIERHSYSEYSFHHFFSQFLTTSRVETQPSGLAALFGASRLGNSQLGQIQTRLIRARLRRSHLPWPSY